MAEKRANGGGDELRALYVRSVAAVGQLDHLRPRPAGKLLRNANEFGVLSAHHEQQAGAREAVANIGLPAGAHARQRARQVVHPISSPQAAAEDVWKSRVRSQPRKKALAVPAIEEGLQAALLQRPSEIRVVRRPGSSRARILDAGAA